LEDSLSVGLVLEASVSPTEERQKVLQAAKNVFGECSYTTEERDELVLLRSSDAACLTKIRDQLRDRHVRAAARRMLVLSREGGRMTLLLNRQAAYVGVISVVSSAEESPLGPIALRLECERTDELMDWLTIPRAEEPQRQVHRGQHGSA